MEDEKDAAEILSRYLALKGHRPSVAGDAEQALEALRASPFDLVLLDIVLPGRTGLQALGDMKALTRAPVHVMSGQNDAESREDARLLGAAGFFGKPLDLEAVSAAAARL